MKHHPDLIVGLESGDDAGVFRINKDTALIQTLDFFTPVIDAPYHFGRIAAANALSDVYAMGGTPLTAMNIVCFPKDDLPVEVLKQTLEGGLEKIYEAGAVLAGGHSVDDKEFKYGLSVTGRVHPDKVLTNRNAQTGDALILTKPIGTGVLATAVKGKIADEEAIAVLIDVTSSLNKTSSQVMSDFSPNACTDVTGFGLAGHILEVAKGSKKSITIDSHLIPFIPKAVEYASMGIIPAGAYDISAYCKKDISIDPKVRPVDTDLLFDPQTSGGLIISLPAKNAAACLQALIDNGVEAAIIGEVASDHPAGHLKIM